MEKQRKELLRIKEENERKKRIELLKSKKNELNKIREEIEKVMQNQKKEKEKKEKEKEEKKKKKKQKEEKEKKEKDLREKNKRKNEVNKIKEKIRKKMEIINNNLNNLGLFKFNDNNEDNKNDDKGDYSKSKGKNKNKMSKSLYNNNRNISLYNNNNSLYNYNNSLNNNNNLYLNNNKNKSNQSLNNNRNKSNKSLSNNKSNRNKTLNINRKKKLIGNQIRVIFSGTDDNDDINIGEKNLYDLKKFKLKSLHNQYPLDQSPVIDSVKTTTNVTQDYSNKFMFKQIFSEDQKTESNEVEFRQKIKLMSKKRKNKTNINIYSDPLNPYLTNWTRSFLKIGFNTGIYANKTREGVPLLMAHRLIPKLEFPPIYNIKYNQFSKSKKFGENNEEKIYNNDKNNKSLTHFREGEKEEEKLDYRNTSINNDYNTDRKINISKDINVEENNKTIFIQKNE